MTPEESTVGTASASSAEASAAVEVAHALRLAAEGRPHPDLGARIVAVRASQRRSRAAFATDHGIDPDQLVRLEDGWLPPEAAPASLRALLRP